MEPSRELDALVAENIIGRCAHSLVKLIDHYECRKCGEEFWGLAWHKGYCAFPSYSTDIAAAWTVDKPGWLWEFQEAVGVLSVTLYTSPALRHKAINMYPVLPEGVILIRRIWLDDKAQTYAWLRCLAALEAAGVEVGDD